MILVCQHCNRQFTTTERKRKYCSAKCYHIARTNPPIYTCQRCGREFPDPNYNRTRKFCSKQCKDLTPIESRPVLTCAQCLKQFTTSRGHKVSPKFCSRSCYSVWKRQHANLVVCKQCGTSFVNPGNPNPQFCSRSCLFLYRGPTSIETIVANLLTELNEPFTSQYPIGQFTFDFIVPSRRILIECDGTYWHSFPEAQNRDRIKDDLAIRNGYTVLRLPQSLIKDRELCKQTIIAAWQ